MSEIESAQLSEYLKQAEAFVLKSGREALEKWKDVVISKSKEGGADVTTLMDEKIEKEFAEFVLENFPEHGFMGEEFQELNRDAEYVWVIDPIDGTKFYAADVPLWGVTVALMKGREAVLGIIFNPVSGNMYKAYKGGGAFVNDRQIHVREHYDCQKSQIVWDLGVKGDEKGRVIDELSPVLIGLMKEFYRVRNFGLGTMSLAWLAKGFFGGYVAPRMHKEKIVDIGGGMIIAREAGAEVSIEDVKGDCMRVIVGKKEVAERIKQVFEDRL